MTQAKCLVCGKDTGADVTDTDEPRICEEHWRCPKCGVGVWVNSDTDNADSPGKEGFVFDPGVDNDGYVQCFNCGSEWTSRTVEKAIIKKLGMVTCPCCKGAGSVDKKTADKFMKAAGKKG